MPTPDEWSVTRDLIITHNTPCTTLFVPTDENCPMPTKYIDILRSTETDLDDLSESRIQHYWTSSGDKELSSAWMGRTTFDLLRPRPLVGYSYVEGRLTKAQETSRPGNVWPEIWRTPSKRQKAKVITDWQHLSSEHDKERARRGISHVPEDEIEAYTKVLSKAREQHSTEESPAMPLMRGEHPPAGSVQGNTFAEKQRATPCSKHQDNIAPAGQASEFSSALVHTPVKG